MSQLQLLRSEKRQGRIFTILGTLRSDEGDCNENVKKKNKQTNKQTNNQTKGLITKTTILHVRQAILYIFLLSPHDYDVKMPNFTVYRGSTQATTKFPLSSELGYGS